MSLHCWTEGPRSDEWTDSEMTTTCMLEAGHAGEHQWTRDDRITIAFAAPNAPSRTLHETEKALAEIIAKEGA
jgi:hypothetical protein